MEKRFDGELLPEDYQEPRCVICDVTENWNPGGSMPLERIIGKYDEYMGEKDYEGARRHLNYWLEEGQILNDRKGMFSIHNEFLGFSRMTGDREGAYSHIAPALGLLKGLGMEDSISAATCYINIATVYDAFGEPEKSEEYFNKARRIYEEHLQDDDARLGGLYNNMALSMNDTGRFDEAIELYRKAIEVMGRREDGKLEQAISYLNMANAIVDRDGADASEEEVYGCLDRAAELFDDPSVPRNSYYAYVCEKSTGTFEFYGWTAYAAELTERARKIYEGA